MTVSPEQAVMNLAVKCADLDIENQRLKAEHGEMKALLMTLMDVAAEGASGHRTYDFEPRAQSAVAAARSLLAALGAK